VSSRVYISVVSVPVFVLFLIEDGFEGVGAEVAATGTPPASRFNKRALVDEYGVFWAIALYAALRREELVAKKDRYESVSGAPRFQRAVTTRARSSPERRSRRGIHEAGGLASAGRK
jgi:hypothetical protein